MPYPPLQAINLSTGEPGSLRFVDVATSRSITETDGGAVLRVDPAGGTVTLTLEVTPGAGFFCEIVQVGTGTVNFGVGAGATVQSTAGATPAVSAQWGAAVVTRHPSEWVVSGSLV